MTGSTTASPDRLEDERDSGVRLRVPVQVDPWASSRRPEDAERLREIVGSHFDFIWRSLRRLGLVEADADDACQKVFCIAARKLVCIEVGSERAYLFGTAVRVASDARRARARRPEQFGVEMEWLRDAAPNPEELTSRVRDRRRLDAILDTLPLDLRAVFVLFELEELGTADIAELLQIPTGTVASRLRRAREAFQAAVHRMQARDRFDDCRAFDSEGRHD